MNDNHPPNELLDLFWLACDGSATPDQIAALSDRIEADPTAMRLYVEFVAMHADLQWGHDAKSPLPSDIPSLPIPGSDEPSTPHQQSPDSKRSAKPAVIHVPQLTGELELSFQQGMPSQPGAFGLKGLTLFGFGWTSLVAVALFAAIIGILSAQAWILSHRPEVPLARRDSELLPTPVAYLTNANGCAWGGQKQDLWHTGRKVRVGDELMLHEGIAEFHLASGVAISIEGPTAIVVNSANSLVVQYGKISAHVPWAVTDFKILASTCRITACEAEFGVKITGSEVEIHTFAGEVVVGSSPFELLTPDRLEDDLDITKFRRTEKDLPSGSEFVETCVPKGRALRLMGGRNGMKIVRWQRAKEPEFTTKLSMAGPLYVTDDYVNVVKESKPVAYWRFETLANGRVPSEMSPANDLRVIGKARLVMNGGGRVVELGRPGCEGFLVSSEPLNELAASDYSMEVWFKPSHVHRGGLLGLAVNQHLQLDQVGPTNFHAFFLETVGALVPASLQELGLGNPASVRFLHRDPPGTRFRTGTSCFSAKPYAPRRWQQLVAVKEGSTMRMYLNGNLTGTAEDPTALARGLYLEVGQVIGSRDNLPFIGQLDELSVYDRVLSEREIKQHYKAMNSAERKIRKTQGTEA